MSEISLRAYVDYIQDRLERDAYSEVVAQSRHVLEAYPKYIEVYKLLARALLEQENYQDATDLFQRVLSADPNDFVAHVGISACHHESGALDEAIWHLERAFEQAPNNVELQEEIKRLHAERDGSSPRKVQLTAGALARLYMNGRLYPQAILELRKALSRDPERPDLQVLLAEALWHDHQQVEAGELAASVLKRLPNSLDANRLLARLWLHAGQTREAQPFLERIDEIDPYLGYNLRNQGESAPPDAFQLEMLDYTAERHASEVGAAEWVSQIRSVEKSDTVTGSLKGPSQAVTNVFDEEDAAPTADGKPPAEGGIPDWLQGAYTSSLEAEESAREEEAESPRAEPPLDLDRLFNDSAQGAPGGGQPDWLADVLSTPSKPEPNDEPLADEATPGWLDEIIGGGASAAAPVVEPSTGDEDDAPQTKPLSAPTPDWLKDILHEDEAAEQQIATAEEAAPATEAEPEPEEADAGRTPAWLTAALAEPDKPADDESAPPLAPVPELLAKEERTAPGWLDDILTGRDQPPTREAESAGDAPSVVSTDWLNQIIVSGGAEVEDAPEEGFFAVGDGEAPPDWLQEIEPEGDDTGELIDFGELEPWDSSALEATRKAPPAEEPLPDWLSAIEPGEPEQADIIPTDLNETEEEALPGTPQPEAAAAQSAPGAFREEEQVTPPTDEPTGEETPQEEIPEWLVDGDLDNSADAIAWLEELAAKYDPDFQSSQGADEAADVSAEQAGPEPSEEATPSPIQEAETEAEALPSWLLEEDEEDAPVAETPETQAAERTVESREEQMDVEPEGDDFPDWLTGAPAPAARAPQGEASDELPDWLREDVEEARERTRALSDIEEEEEPPEWISRVPGRAEAAPEPEPEAEADWMSQPEPPAEPVSAIGDADETLDWLSDEPAVTAETGPAAEEEEEDLSWLEVEEEPAAMAAPPAPAEAEEAGEEELPDWLKDLREPAAEQEDDLDWLYEAIDEQEEEEEAAAPAAEDEAIPGWLGEPEAAEEPAAELAETPETEQALDWLDEQVEAQGVRADEVVSEALTVDHPPRPEPPTGAGEDEEAEPVAEEEMPEWLRGIEPEEAVAQAAGEPEDELEAELLRAADLEAGEDELAWLDSALEAEEMTLSEDDFEDLFGEVAEVTGEEAEPEAAPAGPAAEAEAEPIMETVAEPDAEAEEEAPVIAAEAGMPDWLMTAESAEEAAEVEAEPAVEEEVEEVEVPAALAEPAPTEVTAPEVEEAAEPAAEAEEAEPEPEPAVEPAVVKPAPAEERAPVMEEAEPVEAVEGDAYEQLRVAREKLSDEFGEALPYYERLVASGSMLEQTVSDLTYYLRSEAKPDPRARRVLGDAYREQGRLQDALETYRTALDEL